MSELFIPKKIRAGYQDRDDTYTKRLAYVIYFDNKGVLRKEKSWESWRDDEIPFEDFDNTPQSGFVLNKNIERYNWSHFGSNRSYIRMYDPRGIEFEITPENLIGILMCSTCSKRGFDGEFVYAWDGPELVMLPVGTEEYRKAVDFTSRLDQKVSAKTLKPGCSYTTKRGEEELIYVGRFDWYHWDIYRSSKGRTVKKKHIFYNPKINQGTKFVAKDDASSLSCLNNPDPVQNYADIVDAFKADIHSSSIVRWDTTPAVADLSLEFRNEDNYPSLKEGKKNYYELKDGKVHFYNLDVTRKYTTKTVDGRYVYDWQLTGYELCYTGSLDTKTFLRDSSWDGRHREYVNEEELSKRLSTLVDVYMVLESGKKIQITGLYSLGD